MRKWNRSKRGQAMVETSLVLLLFLVMLVGMLDFGQVFFIHQALVNQARLGARYGSVHFDDLAKVKNMVVYGSSVPPPVDGQGFLPPGYLGLTAAMVDVTRTGAGNDDRIVITISNFPFHFFTPWMEETLKVRKITASYPVEAI